MGGTLAEAYSDLLEEMWGGQTSCLAPRAFKVRKGGRTKGGRRRKERRRRSRKRK